MKGLSEMTCMHLNEKVYNLTHNCQTPSVENNSKFKYEILPLCVVQHTNKILPHPCGFNLSIGPVLKGTL